MDTSGSLISNRIPWTWLFILAGAVIYIPFIGGVHLFDWDEVNFAEVTREMMMTGDYLRVQIDYKPFFEKPPFFFWLQAISMHVFGINEFAARLPNAIGGISVLLFLFKIGSYWINTRFGVLWALSYLGSILPALYHKSGIIDPWFNFFIFASIAAWIEGSRRTSALKMFLISGALCGLAILTKGPVALLLTGLTILLLRIFSGNSQFLSFKALLSFVFACIGISGLWFGIEWLTHGPEFITAFFKYQLELLSESVAGHKGFPGYHFVVALIGVFPASLFAIGAFRKKQSFEVLPLWHLRLAMILITVIVIVLFSVVQSKIVHYSSLTYYPLSFLSAWMITCMLDGKIKWVFIQTIAAALVVTVIGLILFMLPYAGLNLEWVKSNIEFDKFTLGSLNADVVWDNYDFIPFVWFSLLLTTVVILIKRRKWEYSVVTLFIGIAIMVNIFLIFFIGKIEHYSQRAAIEFCQSKSGQHVEIESLGYHSYVPFFYAQKPIPVDSLPMEHFIIIKVDKQHLVDEHPERKKLYEKNGFIFLSK